MEASVKDTLDIITKSSLSCILTALNQFSISFNKPTRHERTLNSNQINWKICKKMSAESFALKVVKILGAVMLIIMQSVKAIGPYMSKLKHFFFFGWNAYVNFSLLNTELDRKKYNI